MAHRIPFISLAMAGAAFAQTSAPGVAEMPAGLFRGAFVDWSGTAASGQLTIRPVAKTIPATPANLELFCYFDSHSYMERDHRRIDVSSLTAGERLEILADHKPGSSICYARTVAVIDPLAEKAADRSRQTKSTPDPTRPLFFTPRGDRTFAGMVTQLSGRMLTIRTRTGETTVALRPDTNFLDDGVRSAAGDLRVNTHVFIRAGKTIDGALEAYQVMWGRIVAVPEN